MPIRPRWWENPTPQELAWFSGLSPRSKSEIFPWTINERSHPGIHAGLAQCFGCGELGHSRVNGCISTNPFPHPPAFNDWRRSINGKTYTVDKLRMSDEALAALAAEAFEEAIEAPITLSSDDIELLDFIEEQAAASMASPATEATHNSHEDSTSDDEGPNTTQDSFHSATVEGQCQSRVKSRINYCWEHMGSSGVICVSSLLLGGLGGRRAQTLSPGL
ncbi:uncharacterized protein MELLADRAFT_94184 [Melampsora larici-populina 98AG31]|uniref:Uncharacterized protein n=1 Tax=Melampsora larici-populina (strain 98AG31 / pathotype 3-4-7) TaxID=747676 RepID=F4S6S3_MELLP|nr:uncharacterized protein MELLADRAFT_94184 [Melampsora larici-populina 98AG31]EGF99668.1 hypothetical protein MELLADRAFT_94184 [Melampsora larici-populina 98AG31]